MEKIVDFGVEYKNKTGKDLKDNLPLKTYKVDESNQPIQKLDDLVTQTIKAERELALAKEKATNLKNKVLGTLQELYLKSYDTTEFKATQTPKHFTNRFDSKAFKVKHVQLYKEYQKESVTKASVKITKK